MKEAVIGMAHRGRLNVLANVMSKPFSAIFHEFKGGSSTPDEVEGSGDVKYHLGSVGTFVSPSGAELPIEMAANPSHLETVDPIVLGVVRAMQDQIDPPLSYSVLPLLMHGDAAFEPGEDVLCFFAQRFVIGDLKLITNFRIYICN